MSKTARAFCPGHVTGFFRIFDTHPELLSRGSRGVGICLELGMTTAVTVDSGDGLEITLNGETSKAPVTRDAIEYLLDGHAKSIVVESVTSLPEGQGFGMSGAGALSTALALAETLGFPRQMAAEAAHVAELQNRTGLGDVTGQLTGGIPFRIREGIPPRGEVLPILEDAEVVLCVVGKPLDTGKVLADEKRREAIDLHGAECVRDLLEEPTLSEMLRLSGKFAQETSLMSKEVSKAVKAAEEFGQASMAMLGNSVFAVGDAEALESCLKKYGDVLVTRIDQKGARLVP